MSHHGHPAGPEHGMYGHNTQQQPPQVPYGGIPPGATNFYRELPPPIPQQQAPPTGPGTRQRTSSSTRRPSNAAAAANNSQLPPAAFPDPGSSGTPAPQYSTPAPTRQKSKAYSTSLAAHSDDMKYQGKYKDLKRKVREIESDNDKLHLKVLKTKRNIQRIRLERAILYERLAALGETDVPPMEHDPHLAAGLQHSQHPQQQHIDPRGLPRPLPGGGVDPRHYSGDLQQYDAHSTDMQYDQQQQPLRRSHPNGSGDHRRGSEQSQTSREGGSGGTESGALQNLAVQALEHERDGENGNAHAGSPDRGREGDFNEYVERD